MKIALVLEGSGKGNQISRAKVNLSPDKEDEYPRLEEFIKDAKISDYIKVTSPTVPIEIKRADALRELKSRDGRLLFEAEISITPDSDEDIERLTKLAEEAKKGEFIKVSSVKTYIEARGHDVGVDFE